MKIIVVGGGAAGFFTAINIAEKHPGYQVTILEKTNKLLSKVKVSGGGRCNVTNALNKPAELINFYPRGNKKLYPLFQQFSTTNMVEWLEKRGVKTHTEDDLRMFPVTNSSQTIIDCFVNEAWNHKVKIVQNCAMTGLERISLERTEGDKPEQMTSDDSWIVKTTSGDYEADKVVLATGASPALWKQLEAFGLKIVPPVPSLFTFNIKDERISGLQGISFADAKIKIAGTKLEASGPLLITHWGLSGPSVLKLSAYGARELADLNYQFKILVNFLGNSTPEEIKQQLVDQKHVNPKRKVINYPVDGIPKRFWEQLISFCDISGETLYGELTKRQINKLTEELGQGLYDVRGKSTFKEEFVTSGGIELSEVNLQTFECTRFKNLYVAGEMLDIDALTGGFNFQACWTAGWIISEKI